MAGMSFLLKWLFSTSPWIWTLCFVQSWVKFKARINCLPRSRSFLEALLSSRVLLIRQGHRQGKWAIPILLMRHVRIFLYWRTFFFIDSKLISYANNEAEHAIEVDHPGESQGIKGIYKRPPLYRGTIWLALYWGTLCLTLRMRSSVCCYGRCDQYIGLDLHCNPWKQF